MFFVAHCALVLHRCSSVTILYLQAVNETPARIDRWLFVRAVVLLLGPCSISHAALFSHLPLVVVLCIASIMLLHFAFVMSATFDSHVSSMPSVVKSNKMSGLVINYREHRVDLQ